MKTARRNLWEEVSYLRGFKIIIIAPVLYLSLIGAQMINAVDMRLIGNRLDKHLVHRISGMIARAAIDSVGVLLSDNGYLDCIISSAGDTVVVDPGRQFRMGDIILKIVGGINHSSRKTLRDFRGLEVTRENMDAVKSELLEPYQNNGHYFATLNTENIIKTESDLNPEFILITGPVVEIIRLRFRGLKKSKPEFVRKLSGLHEGEPFTLEKYKDAIRKIEAGDYLRSDSLPQIAPNQSYDGVELLFYLSELKSNRLELGGGYLPGRASEKGEVVGRIAFGSKNLFGSGRRIDILFDRKDRASSLIDFNFGQPFFVPEHMEVLLHLNQVDYDSSYYSFKMAGDVSLIARGGSRVGGGLSWTKTEPQRSSQSPSRALAGTARYELRRLDYISNPSAGSHLKISLSYIRRLTWPDSVATTVIDNESMFEIRADNYIRLARKMVFRVNLKTEVLITPRELIDYSEQFKLGGFRSLRGYRQDQFAGRRTLLAQMEFRFRPSRESAIYLFSDLGLIYGRKEVKQDIVESETIIRSGSGFGLFVGSSAARMTLEVGWGRHDRIDEGKIHFGLVTLF